MPVESMACERVDIIHRQRYDDGLSTDGACRPNTRGEHAFGDLSMSNRNFYSVEREGKKEQ